MVGEQVLQESGRIVKGNVIHATLQGLLPHIYAKNPEIKIRPLEYVDPTGQDYRMSDLFSQTLQMVLNESFVKADLKRVAKQVLRSCMTSKIGIVKVTYQRDYYRDPLVSRQFNDAQESLAKIKTDIAMLMDEGNYDGDKDEIIEELEQTIMGLQAKVDVMHREGLNLGFVKGSTHGKKYKEIEYKISDALAFMEACGINPESNRRLRTVNFYTSHEALLLPFEQAMTRVDSTTGEYHDTSAHFVWIGDRTRQPDLSLIHI